MLLGDTNRVVTIHGEESEDDGEGVFMGGLDAELGTRVGALLMEQGFEVRKHPDPNLQGLDLPECLQSRHRWRGCPAGALTGSARDAVRITHA